MIQNPGSKFKPTPDSKKSRSSKSSKTIHFDETFTIRMFFDPCSQCNFTIQLFFQQLYSVISISKFQTSEFLLLCIYNKFPSGRRNE